MLKPKQQSTLFTNVELCVPILILSELHIRYIDVGSNFLLVIREHLLLGVVCNKITVSAVD